MRDDFAVFITTHERARKQMTLDWIKGAGYTGRYYLVIDDMDAMKDEYKETYGSENVLVFDKLKYWAKCDTMNNRQHLAAVLYARQYVEEAAAEMGLKAFLVMDDDISRFTLRAPGDGKTRRRKDIKADKLFSRIVDFMLASGIASVSPGTQNLYMAGNKIFDKFPRKASNAFFRNTAIPVEWKSAMNEDLITCIEYNKRGVLMCTTPFICCESPKAGTGTVDGGMQKIYEAMTDYERGFYAVIADPARVYLKMNRTKKQAGLRIARSWAGGGPVHIE